MSGIVGIFHRDAKPVDSDLLSAMTVSLAYRGPDQQRIWVNLNVGLGQATLCTTWESEREQQPLTLDNRAWIIADARIDGRPDLIRELDGQNPRLASAPDAELILRAYERWGERCLEHLIGDFAFAIWDKERHQLFCARDHFGVKPFLYAEIGSTFVFSNDLNCVRRYPGLNQDLNEEALAHFVLFGHNRNLETTTFAVLRRLPPAHAICVSADNLRRTRYWSLPLDGCIRYKKNGEYIDHFRDLLSTAVQDRMRADSVAFFMSGGLDSPSITALGMGSAAVQNGRTAVESFTAVDEAAAPDEERCYSAIAARYLGIETNFVVFNEHRILERIYQPETLPPEPNDNAQLAWVLDLYRQTAQFSRTVLTGLGGDPLMLQTYKPLEQWGWGPLISTAVRLLVAHRRLPRIGFRTSLRRLAGRANECSGPQFPAWFNPVLANRHNLRTAWHRRHSDISAHPLRPDAYRAMDDEIWSSVFQADDPGSTHSQLEIRNVFFDVRVVTYALAMPPIPWFQEKYILRRAMKGLIPEKVRLRPKTTVRYPAVATRMNEVQRSIAAWSPSPSIRYFIDWQALSAQLNPARPMDYYEALQLMCLDRWLQANDLHYCAGMR